MKKIQLFILPYAGGRADLFKPLVEQLDDDIDAIPIEYAGRGQRAQEGYIDDYQKFLEDVVSNIAIRRDTNLPYALFGYSMGASFVYEIASQQLLDQLPMHLFYGARACIAECPVKDMTNEEFMEHAKMLGGFDERIVSNPRYYKLFTHPLVDDFSIAKQFRYIPGKSPVCDVTVLYSEEDTPCEDVKGWSKLTKGTTTFYCFSGNHFFIREHYCEVAHIINQKLKEKVT